MSDAAPVGEATAETVSHGQLKSRVIGGALWFMSGTVARAVLRLIVMAVLARLLVPAEFGLFGAAGIFVAFAELFSISGIVHMVVQKKELEPRHVRAAFTGNLAMGILTALVIYLLAGPIAIFFRMPGLEPILELLSLLFPLNSVSAVSQKLLERDFSYGRLAAVDVTSYFFGYGLVALSCAWAGYGVWSLVYALLGSAALRSIFLMWTQPHPFRLSLDRRSYMEMMRTGAGFSLARYASFTARKGDYFVVGRWLGAAPLGLYERAYVLMDLSNSLLTSALNTVLFPAFAKIQDDRQKLAAVFARVSAVLGFIFLPAGVIASLLAPEIIRVLLGSGWSAAVDPFRVLALGMFFRTGFKVSGVLANGVGASYWNATYHAIYACFVVGGAFATYRYGITAVAFSTLVALIVTYFLLTRHSLVVTGTTWSQLAGIYTPPAKIMVILGLAAWATSWAMRDLGAPPLATLAATGALLLAILLLLMRFRPKLFGPHGQWILATLLEGIMKRKRSASSANRKGELVDRH